MATVLPRKADRRLRGRHHDFDMLWANRHECGRHPPQRAQRSLVNEVGSLRTPLLIAASVSVWPCVIQARANRRRCAESDETDWLLDRGTRCGRKRVGFCAA